MGRRKLYATDEDRKAARRESNRRYNIKRKSIATASKETNVMDTEWDRLMNINPDLYPTKQHLSNDQKDFIKAMLSRPVNDTPLEINTRRTKCAAEAKKQLGLAMKAIKRKTMDGVRSPKGIGSIDFDMTRMGDADRKWFYDHVEDVIRSLLKKIDLNEHWTVYYEYDNSWKQRTLDSITQTFLTNQLQT